MRARDDGQASRSRVGRREGGREVGTRGSSPKQTQFWMEFLMVGTVPGFLCMFKHFIFT